MNKPQTVKAQVKVRSVYALHKPLTISAPSIKPGITLTSVAAKTLPAPSKSHASQDEQPATI